MEEKIINAILDTQSTVQAIAQGVKDISKTVQRHTGVLDSHSSILQRLDEERLSAIERVQRIEEALETQQKVVKNIKAQLNIV